MLVLALRWRVCLPDVHVGYGFRTSPASGYGFGTNSKDIIPTTPKGLVSALEMGMHWINPEVMRGPRIRSTARSTGACWACGYT